ncbi:hypothetical protein GPJ56_003011 [Histomonas meleagridis]|uniref:uncharacterized protein n=1 Tax=Histomonas meleagridis TaxID=135588 RepID=UPI00355A333F|nr:hypothetical protein GPJ56_003011 [Histomonas meleagridis]KAH0796667.1 hypothetical protein GO595_010560 [Histomonas meleagridis]
MVNSLVRCLCGPGCAVCWIFIGIWAFFFLGIIALLFYLDKPGNIGHFSRSNIENARNIFYAWIIYVVIVILCGINFWYRRKHPFPPKEDDEAVKKKIQFSAIGSTTLAPTTETPLLEKEK